MFRELICCETLLLIFYCNGSAMASAKVSGLPLVLALDYGEPLLGERFAKSITFGEPTSLYDYSRFAIYYDFSRFYKFLRYILCV